MKKLLFIILGLHASISSFAKADEAATLISFGKAYKDFMFRNEAPKEFLSNLVVDVPDNLVPTSHFIVECIKSDNRLLKPEFLSLPDSATLKYIYIVRSINLNIREENQKDNYKLIDSFKATRIPRNELIDNYYSMLFSGIGNKDQPFNMSRVDFKLNEYNLNNETEKGILFLECMRLCGMNIWGYINVVKPPNTEKAYEMIKKFPRFNGLPYFEFTDLNFPDFEMTIIEGKGPQSYKSYYIDKYYDLLLSHLICLKKENAKQKLVDDLLLGSVLKDQNLYKYTQNKDLLESIFKEQKQ